MKLSTQTIFKSSHNYPNSYYLGWDNSKNNNSLSVREHFEGVVATFSICTTRGHTMIITEDTIKRYRANQGYVYLIHAVGTNRYKIGRSVNPVARLETLKGQSPYPLQIVECFWTPDAIADERHFHQRDWLSKKRRYGEWFELSSEKSVSITEVEHLEIQFGSCSPTCYQYLNTAFENIVQKSGLFKDAKENDYPSEVYDNIYDLYKPIRNLNDLQKIVSFTFEYLGYQVEGCKDIASLIEITTTLCDNAAYLVFGKTLIELRYPICQVNKADIARGES